MDSPAPEPIRGRGAQSRPANPYLQVRTEVDLEHFEGAWGAQNPGAEGDGAGEYFDTDADFLRSLGRPPTEYFADESQSIVSENDSPDIPFRYSVNPYRGCSHGCSYCYARPTHEYLGLSAGLDFETRIFVKHDAAKLFRRWLARPAYVPAPVMFSGVTDPYQPAERRYRVTRACLEVAAECRQPVGMVTKNALVTRDVDLLADLAKDGAARVAVSLTTLDAGLARVMEPQTSSPEARLRAIEELTAAGAPVHVMLAPLIPGLNDSEAPALLKAAREAGAATASHILLRLPTTVRPVFLEWLERFEPDRRDRVVALMKQARGGKLNDARYGVRMRGVGAYAEQVAQTVAVVTRSLGYAASAPPLRTDLFRSPSDSAGQRRLF